MNKSAEKYIIEQLVALKVTSGRYGESLYGMDYRSLVSLLAVREAVNS